MASWAQAAVFQGLAENTLVRLGEISCERALVDGQELFCQGETCRGLYVLLEGAVLVRRTRSFGGTPSVMAIIQPVQSFGEAALFGDGCYPASAFSLKGSRVRIFPAKRFLAVMDSEPSLCRAMIQAQARWLRAMVGRIDLLCLPTGLERLRCWLMETMVADSFQRLPVTKKILAATLGMTPETLSRALRRLETLGVVDLQGDRIRVHRQRAGTQASSEGLS
nr:Crp/Fnr family transcriptional regulator [uncultured Holophaga sp.]